MDTTLDEQRAIVSQRQESLRQMAESEKLAATLRRIQKLANLVAQKEEG